MKLIYLLFAAPLSGFAAQFVLFDVTFTYTKTDADNSTPSKSHYYVRDKLGNHWRRWLTVRMLGRYFKDHAFYELLKNPDSPYLRCLSPSRRNHTERSPGCSAQNLQRVGHWSR